VQVVATGGRPSVLGNKFLPEPSMVLKRMPCDLSQLMYVSQGTGGPPKGLKWL
jgi:hypothetical protein